MFSMRKIITTTNIVQPMNTKRVIRGAGLKTNIPLQHKLQTPKKRKDTIPVKLREEVWIKRMGRSFEGKCPTTWCTNNITVFDFESGHNIPESMGGPTTIENLVPICSRCNRSMGSQHTFDQWCIMYSSPLSNLNEATMLNPKKNSGVLSRFFSCFSNSKLKQRL